ncbi:MAG: response regulator [Blautia sp.]|nr:response regulator [Blautia sp.]
MIKLFLAEDEIAMRDGIKRHIHWAEEGIDFCGEAGDGELAWPMILEQKPDIVITDIKMPFMDGLQLSRLIRRELPDTRIIILSGYSEFEYAQEALRLGVSEYLLKPIMPKQLLEVVRKQAAAVEEEKKNREMRIDWLQEEEREKDEHNRRKLFRMLISGDMASHEILEFADSIGLQLGAPYYRLLLAFVLYDADYRNQERVDEILQGIADEVPGCFVFEHSVDSVAVLVTGKTPEDVEDKTQQLEGRINGSVQEAKELHFFMSAGRTVSHLSEIHTVYREVYRTASHRYFLTPDQMVTSETPISRLLTENNPNPINTDSALQNGNLRSIWENFMRTGTQQETKDFVSDVFSSVGEDNVQSLLFLNYLTMDCYFTMVRFLKDLGKDPGEVNNAVGDINAVMGALKSAEDSERYLTDYLQEVIRQRDSSTSRRNDQLIQTATAYIDAHFTDGSLSLQETASAVGLSPNRFSTLFSHELGMTFIEYLINKRMERACELLMTTDLKSFEVAYRSGYNDPHYFSATFKKSMGMSPTEYRQRRETKDTAGSSLS